jgi:hypothetical protein
MTSAEFLLTDGSAAGVDSTGDSGCLGLAVPHLARRLIPARPQFNGFYVVRHPVCQRQSLNLHIVTFVRRAGTQFV